MIWKLQKKKKRFPSAFGGNNFEHQMRGAPWGQCCSWSCQSLIHIHSLGKMQNIKSMLSRITAAMPFSGEPKHPPALVVQLRGQQHSGAALWVEPASKCERYFPSNSKGTSFSHSLGKIQKQIWRWFRYVATESDDLRFILKQSTEIYTNKNKQTFWRCRSIGLTVTHIGLQPHSSMLILASAHNSCQLCFALN